ncbi:MAG: DUF6599 family protein [Polyangiales bacterium]
MIRRVVCFAALLLACKRESTPARTPPPAPPASSASEAGAPAGPAREPPAAAAAFREAGRFLPQGASVQGWTQSGTVRLVDAGHLYELIDGAAEKYVSYGFRQLARADYRQPQGTLVVTVEVYDMGAELGAFGQYSMILSDGRDPSTLQPSAQSLGAGGFLGSTQLVFWKGQHLVQVNLTDDGDDADEAAMRAAASASLPRFGAAVAALLPGSTAAPAPPAGLSAEGLVWGGMTYLANNAFGVERTGPAWVGHYRGDDGARYRLAVLTRPSVAEAHGVFSALRAAGATAIAGLGDEAFAGRVPEGEVVVARRGSAVVVVADPAGAGLTAPPRDAKRARLAAALSSLP